MGLEAMAESIQGAFCNTLTEFHSQDHRHDSFTQDPERVHVNRYAESEGGMWDSEDTELLDPRVIERACSGELGK